MLTIGGAIQARCVTHRPRRSHRCHTHVAAKDAASPEDLITSAMSRMARVLVLRTATTDVCGARQSHSYANLHTWMSGLQALRGLSHSELSLMDRASLTTTPLATCQQKKRASGQACGDPRDRVTAALAGVALGLAGARGLLTLPLHEFRVDGAQTPLTGHLPPPRTAWGRRGHRRCAPDR